MTKEKGSVKESKVFLRGRDSGIFQRVTASEKLKIGWRAKMWKQAGSVQGCLIHRECPQCDEEDT